MIILALKVYNLFFIVLYSQVVRAFTLWIGKDKNKVYIMLSVTLWSLTKRSHYWGKH